jgi:hypothetical protein
VRAAATGRSSGQRDANVVNGFGHSASPNAPLPVLPEHSQGQVVSARSSKH